jgi:membrane-associated phospholipid phosphatase
MLVGTAAAAQNSAQQEDGERRATLANDVKLYVTAPLHARKPQWVRFGAVVGAVAFAYRFDDDVRERFDTALAPADDEPDLRDTEDAVPAALAVGGTWLAAVLLDDDAGRREVHAMLEAAGFGAVAAYALKAVAGRERPFETLDPDAFGNDGDAFPSTHTAAAFAIGTVLAESGNQRHRWLRRTLGYGLAAATAYKRLDHDAHWLSDTVAGAGLGIATARFVMKRRAADAPRGRLELTPVGDGLGIAYTVALRP